MLWVDTTRILAIFAVVWLHVAAGVVGSADGFGSVPWWICNLYNACGRWCVPAFVMLSGALLLAEDRTESMSVFYRKRASRLLLPLLFWSLFYLAWTYLRGRLLGDVPSLRSLGGLLLSGNPYYHMWFLYMLIGLYFATPFLRILIRNLTAREMALFLTVTFCMAAVNSVYSNFGVRGKPLFIFWFLSYLPYFVLGHVIRKSAWAPRQALALLVFSLSAAGTAVACFVVAQSYGLEKGLYFYSPLSVTIIPLSISALYLLRGSAFPLVNAPFTRDLAGLVLGVYLLHPVLLDVLRYVNINALMCTPLVSVPLIAIPVFVGAAAITWVGQRIPYLRRTL